MDIYVETSDKNSDSSIKTKLRKPTSFTNQIDKWEIQPKRILGIKQYDKYRCCEFISDHIVVYPTGYYLAVFNFKEDCTNYLTLGKQYLIQNIFISLEKKLITLEENVSDALSNIAFISLENGSLIKRIENIDHKNILDLKFSPNGQIFLTCSKSTWTLNLWNFEELVLLDHLNLFDSSIYPYRTINEISFYPSDSKRVLMYGRASFHSYSIENDKFSLKWSIMHPGNVLSHVWLNSNKLMVGDDAGVFTIVDTCKASYESSFIACNVTSELEEKRPSQILLSQSHSNKNNDTLSEDEKFFQNFNKIEIRSLIEYSSGFICLLNKNIVQVYKRFIDGKFQKTDHKCNFVADKNLSKLFSDFRQIGYPLQQNEQVIERLILNRSETYLIAFTNWNRIYKVDFKNEYELGNELNIILVQTFHYSKITGVDICMRKSYLVTCSQEGLIIVWNYETGRQVFYKELDEKLYSICVHPTGFYLAVACFEKINFYDLIHDDIKLLHSFSVAQCNHCLFSNDGQYLAVINANLLTIFNTAGYLEKISIKLKAGKICDFQWASDDQNILVSSTRGFLSMFDINTGDKVVEQAIKRNAYRKLDIHRNQTLKSMFVLERNQELRRFSIKTENLSSDENNLFYGHMAPITKTKFSSNDQFFVSCSEDGMIILWSVNESTSLIRSESRLLPNASFDLSNELDVHSQLRESIADTKNIDECECEEMLLEISQNDEFKALNSNFNQILNEFRKVYDKFKAKDEERTSFYESKLKKLKEIFDKDYENMRERLERSLVEKYHQIDHLVKIYNETLLKKDEDKRQENRNRESQLIKLITKEEELRVTCLISVNELQRKHREELKTCKYKIDLQEEENRQIEMDGDQEIANLKRHYEERIEFFKANNESLMLENYFIRKKLGDNEEKMRDLVAKDRKLTEFFITNKNRNNVLKDRIFNLKQTLNLRENELNEEDQKVMELKHEAQYKEKLRLINEHKIKEYFQNMEPLKANNDSLKKETIDLEGTLMETIEELSKLKAKKDRFTNNYNKSLLKLKKTRETKFRTDMVRSLIETTLADLIELKIDAPDKLRSYIDNVTCKLPRLDSYTEANTDVIRIIGEQKRYLTRIVNEQKRLNAEEERTCEIKVFHEVKEGTDMIRKYDVNTRRKRYYKSRLGKLKARIFGINSNENNSRLAEQLKQMINYFKFDNAESSFEQDKNSNLIFLQMNIIKKLERQCRIVARNLFQLYSQSKSVDMDDLKDFLSFIDSQ